LAAYIGFRRFSAVFVKTKSLISLESVRLASDPFLNRENGEGPIEGRLIATTFSLYPSRPMDRLKLSALDAEDLGVISAAVQDSLVAVRDCAYFADEKRFILLLNRFCWEADPGVDSQFWRIHSALVFNEVSAVHHHKIPLQQPDRMLELLSIGLENGGSVALDFSAERRIRLEIGRLACHLGDVGEPWATPWKPAHPVE
jgi:hypothetical protein